MVSLVCHACSTRFEGRPDRKYCSPRCVNKVRDLKRGPACTGCGKKMYAARVVANSPTCQSCRRSRPGYRNKNLPRTQRWDCQSCGTPCERPTARGTKPKWCDLCRKLACNREIKISRVGRLEIYERDAWTCWLCTEAVDRALIGTHSIWRPGLDHVEPSSRGGTDDPENLKLAHWWCNSARSDGRTYSPEDFRVSI